MGQSSARPSGSGSRCGIAGKGVLSAHAPDMQAIAASRTLFTLTT